MHGKRILVIEDDDGIRAMLGVALKFEGYEVTLARDGREALEALGSLHRPGLILLDLMMPVMNGWEFYEELKKKPRLANIPVVILSAFFEKGEPIEAKAVIKKPFDLDELLTAVNRFVEDLPGGAER